MNFQYVRKKNPLVKRNRLVLYNSQLMRIANTSGDGLKLRSQILCHAKDPDLVIRPSTDFLRAVDMLDTAVEMCISNGEGVWDSIDESEYTDRKQISKIMRQFVRQLQHNVACVISNDDIEE
jgi:hypothetical protein